MTAYPGCAGLARSPFVLTEHISSKYIYICIYVYIYVAVRQVICACSVVRNVGGVKCNHFHKHSNHFK